MVVTQDPVLAERIRLLRSHGMRRQGDSVTFVETGFNYRMTDLQGALGVAQMARLDAFLGKRRSLAAGYIQRLRSAPWADLVMVPAVDSVSSHAFQAFVILLDARLDRRRLIEGLRERGVEAGPGTYSVGEQPAYGGASSCPNAKEAHRRSLSLPMHTRMSEVDLDHVVEVLESALPGARL